MKEVLRRPIKKVPTLPRQGGGEPLLRGSTRTRTSFEIGGQACSPPTRSTGASRGSSVTKGETLVDTARNIEAMHPDVIVIRHPAGGAPQLVAERVGCAVVYAGDGAHEHPSQGLLDLYTLAEHFTRTAGKRTRTRLRLLAGKTVAIVGDVSHSRVARSNLYGLTSSGRQVRCAARPP